MNRQEAAKALIKNDLEGFFDAFFICTQETRTFFMLGGFLYTATILNGAIDWCSKAKIKVTYSVDKKIIEKLRAKVKLYSNDKVIPLEEQRVLMSRIIEVEKQYWIDEQAKNGKWCPKFMIPDVGSYYVNGHCIGNTLEYAYEYSPLNPDGKPILEALKGEDRESSLVYIFSVQLGQTMQSIYDKIYGRQYCPEKQRCNSIKVENRDFRMSHKAFFKKKNAIYAFNLLCRVNYLLELFRPLCNNELLVFRMMYLTLYHLENDLKNLGLDSIHYNMPYKNCCFRNAMAHYSLFGKLSDSEVNDGVIGFGLFEKFFEAPFETVNQSIVFELQQTRDSLEKYVKV